MDGMPTETITPDMAIPERIKSLLQSLRLPALAPFSPIGRAATADAASSPPDCRCCAGSGNWTAATSGHTVVSAIGEDMGGYRAISSVDGVYHGASDHRKDGQAVGW